MQIPLQKGKKAYWNACLGAILALLLLLPSLIYLRDFPLVWWDEGWTLTVARNWVERGYYGRFLAGQPSPPGLEAAFPTTSLVALSFKIFGVGIWQGRLVGVLCAVAALGVMYFLALRLYSPAVAIGTLFVILFMSPHPNLHPLFMGRQVLGENAMLFFLLSGYAFFIMALQRSLWFLGGAVFLWGICLNTKLQVIPFWTISLLIPLGIAWVQKERRSAILWVMAFLGSLIISCLFGWGRQAILRGHTLPVESIRGMYEVHALVLEGLIRLVTLLFSFEYGFGILISLCWAAWKLVPKIRNVSSDFDLALVRLSLLILSGCWFSWYLLLSVGLLRYFYPPVFIGGVFLAALLYELTGHYQPRFLWDCLVNMRQKRRMTREAIGVLLSLLLVTWNLVMTTESFYKSPLVKMDTSALKTAEIFNEQTPEDTLIETYESELHFLLNRRVHYPPDQVHVDLNRRAFLGQPVSVSYNPLAASPDYLILGFQGRLWKLYDSVIESGAFRLMFRVGQYDIYKRVR